MFSFLRRKNIMDERTKEALEEPVYFALDMANSFGEGYRQGYKEGFWAGNEQHKREDIKREVV